MIYYYSLFDNEPSGVTGSHVKEKAKKKQNNIYLHLHHALLNVNKEPTYSQSGSPHCSPPWKRPSSLPESPPLHWLHPSSALAWLPGYPNNLSIPQRILLNIVL